MSREAKRFMMRSEACLGRDFHLFVSVYLCFGETCFKREPLSASPCVKECCGFSLQAESHGLSVTAWGQSQESRIAGFSEPGICLGVRRPMT